MLNTNRATTQVLTRTVRFGLPECSLAMTNNVNGAQALAVFVGHRIVNLYRPKDYFNVKGPLETHGSLLASMNEVVQSYCRAGALAVTQKLTGPPCIRQGDTN